MTMLLCDAVLAAYSTHDVARSRSPKAAGKSLKVPDGPAGRLMLVLYVLMIGAGSDASSA